MKNYLLIIPLFLSMHVSYSSSQEPQWPFMQALENADVDGVKSALNQGFDPALKTLDGTNWVKPLDKATKLKDEQVRKLQALREAESAAYSQALSSSTPGHSIEMSLYFEPAVRATQDRIRSYDAIITLLEHYQPKQ